LEIHKRVLKLKEKNKRTGMSNIPMKAKIIDDKAEEAESITSKHFNR
jgi:hypothetical protein